MEKARSLAEKKDKKFGIIIASSLALTQFFFRVKRIMIETEMFPAEIWSWNGDWIPGDFARNSFFEFSKARNFFNHFPCSILAAVICFHESLFAMLCLVPRRAAEQTYSKERRATCNRNLICDLYILLSSRNRGDRIPADPRSRTRQTRNRPKILIMIKCLKQP